LKIYHSELSARQVLFVLAREDDEGDEEDELQLQPEWAASLAGFPSPDDAPEDFMVAGGEASDEWETDDDGEGEDMEAEVGDQVRLGCGFLGHQGSTSTD